MYNRKYQTRTYRIAKAADATASHVAARLAPVEAERDSLRATVAKLEEFQEINDSEFTAEVYARKQAESERDALRATVAKMREALERIRVMCSEDYDERDPFANIATACMETLAPKEGNAP